jgi:hypothetical protein
LGQREENETRREIDRKEIAERRKNALLKQSKPPVACQGLLLEDMLTCMSLDLI